MKRTPKTAIAVYTGEGASHSWTWFVDIFERGRISNVLFLDENDICSGALDAADVLFVSGGDTFAIAAALGAPGAGALEHFISSGGIYIGACAGAYLLLQSSLEPLHYFNFVQARIANLTSSLPPALQRPEKYCTAYGCRYVYHPVRGEVMMHYRTGSDSLTVHDLAAPLFGGSAMLDSDDIEVLGTYAGFTERTEFLVENEIARTTLFGNVAAARKKFGRGTIYLFGPHFEHPDYPEANQIIFDCIESALTGAGSRCTAVKDFSAASRVPFRRFMAAVSNARIVGLAMERSAYQWLIGAKVYDPEKIRVFLETIWKRARVLEQRGLYCYCSAAEVEILTDRLTEITACLRDLRQDPACGRAEELFRELRRSAALFAGMYFFALRAEEETAAVFAAPGQAGPISEALSAVHENVL
jgi:glutamine amidotransferase-like uncharacterized protein